MKTIFIVLCLNYILQFSCTTGCNKKSEQRPSQPKPPEGKMLKDKGSMAIPATVDFKTKALDYAWREARRHGGSVSLIENLEKEELHSHPEWRRYGLNWFTANFRWLDPIDDTKSIVFSSSRTFENNSSQTITHTFQKKTEITTTYSWVVESGLDLGIHTEVRMGVPEAFDMSTTTSATIGLQSKRATDFSSSEEFSIQNEITIPEQKKVTVTYTVEQRNVTIPFEMDVYIEGWVAVRYSSKTVSKWYWFFPVAQLADEDFVLDGSTVRYKLRGYFRGTRGEIESLRVMTHGETLESLVRLRSSAESRFRETCILSTLLLCQLICLLKSKLL